MFRASQHHPIVVCSEYQANEVRELPNVDALHFNGQCVFSYKPFQNTLSLFVTCPKGLIRKHQKLVFLVTIKVAY